MKEHCDNALIHSPGDLRLWNLCKLLVQTVEWRPEPGGDTGVLFETTVNRYFERISRRERHSAEWYYHNKTAFETKYDEDCKAANGDEPAWVSDRGKAAAALMSLVTYDLDRLQKDPTWLKLWRQKRLLLRPKYRAVLDALAVDWRTTYAARIAGASRPTVDLCKKFSKCISPNAIRHGSAILRFENFTLLRFSLRREIGRGCDRGEVLRRQPPFGKVKSKK